MVSCVSAFTAVIIDENSPDKVYRVQKTWYSALQRPDTRHCRWPLWALSGVNSTFTPFGSDTPRDRWEYPQIYAIMYLDFFFSLSLRFFQEIDSRDNDCSIGIRRLGVS
jgi:hypothetical protein